MKKIYNIKVSTLVMILLPILSILIGYFGVKLYLLSNDNFNDEIDMNRPGVEELIENNNESVNEPLTNEEHLNNTLNESSDTEKRVTKNIGPISYYSIQVGSFSSEENANEFRNALIEKEHFTYNLSDENYKVFVGVSYDKEMLKEELDAVKESSPDAFIKRINLKSKNFSYTISETDYFKEVSRLVTNQINGINASLDIHKLENQLVEIEKINNQFKEADAINKDIANLVTAYVNDLRSKIETIDAENDESIRVFLEKNINLFIKYFR